MRTTLTLGPVPYLWQPDDWRDFYHRVADEADVDTVVVGEVVCSKRLHFHDGLVDEVTARLRRGGKLVRRASLALITQQRELRSLHALVDGAAPIEVGDLTGHAALVGVPHAIGPLVNVYNAATARLLGKQGATTICLPPELPWTSVLGIASNVPEVAFEVFAFGRVPLAISARCAHARVKGTTKDNCRFVCGEEPDGLEVETLDGQPFLALNGVQTVSSTVQNLIVEAAGMQAGGIASLRLSPQVCDMVRVARNFRGVLDGDLEADAALADLRCMAAHYSYSNGFFHGDPGHLWRQ
jgi:collagenase-like PrtC family protease